MACAGGTHYMRSTSKVRAVDIGECGPPTTETVKNGKEARNGDYMRVRGPGKVGDLQMRRSEHPCPGIINVLAVKKPPRDL